MLSAKLWQALEQDVHGEEAKDTMSGYPSQAEVMLNMNAFPVSGKSADISIEILSVVRDSKSETILRALVCDRTAVNTGKNNGVIREIELNIRRPLQ